MQCQVCLEGGGGGRGGGGFIYMVDFLLFLYKAVPVCLPAFSSEQESILNGKNLSPRGANSFLFEMIIFQKGRKTI